MSLASALVAGNDPLPRLAEEALGQALEKSGESRANGVLLFLSPEFSRHAQQTVTAVARAARCTQVAGGIAAGLLTDSGWLLDRPGAAVMVLAGGLSLGHPQTDGASGEPILSYAGSTLSAGWAETATRRFGGSFASSRAVAWQQGRLAEHCSVQLLGAHVDVGISRGWRLLGEALVVDSSNAYDLIRIGGARALDGLIGVLPSACRSHSPLPLASLCAVLIDDAGAAGLAEQQSALVRGACRPIAIIAANADGSLTLAERLVRGQRLAWAIRLPQAAEDDMRQSVARLAAIAPAPLGAVVFSCIGRGPYFYDGEERDIDCLRQFLPEVPLIGVYGTGQIAAGPGMLQNAVVTALISRARSDVQSES